MIPGVQQLSDQGSTPAQRDYEGPGTTYEATKPLAPVTRILLLAGIAGILVRLRFRMVEKVNWTMK